ncbi:MAG TPA: hypothetical protein VMZ51_08245 [Acidimicrobiales bacterium]|nr:hypothetical protein [Acidimicrobiales bacterium]
MGRPTVTQAQLDTLWECYDLSLGLDECARYAKCSTSTARRYFDEGRRQLQVDESEHVEDLRPKRRDELGPEALKALDDIGYFAHRYFGMRLMPWQEHSTEKVLALKETANKEYVCINVAPGSGKTVFYTLVLPAFFICRDRRIRGMTGHASSTIATQEVDALRRMLERTVPVLASQKMIELGISQDAQATLAGDFGRFKPSSGTRIWGRDGFTVAQVDDVPLSEKERTWIAFGLGSTYIGERVDVAVWDDADDPRHRSAYTRDQIKDEWDKVAEERIEPGGLLILQGQRLDADDLYRHNLDKRVHPDGYEAAETDDEGLVPKYHHIVYKAHYDEICENDHGLSAKPWPDGCLLFPARLTWRDLRNRRTGNPSQFAVLYQQEDTGTADTLVHPLWVSGGRDPVTHEEFLGCWDNDRGLCEVPTLVGETYSIVTVDPSPTNWWACQWYIHHPASEQTFLMDTFRGKIGANEFLDYNPATRTYSGLMESWHQRSVALGRPVQHWIVEQNGAQKFLLQYRHVQDWLRINSTTLIAHDTHRNKADATYGITTIGSHWRFGRVRLPGRTAEARAASQLLVDEVTRYPMARYDDQVMAQWFLFWNLPRLVVQNSAQMRYDRPEWAARIPNNWQGAA